jgi:hypothetical protein
MRNAVCALRVGTLGLGLTSLIVGLLACSDRKEAGPQTPVTVPPSMPSVTSPPAPSVTQTLSAWANPITVAGVRFADHTWVTTYDAPSPCPPPTVYWYSWGGCHTTGSGTTATLLSHRPASVDVARCICEPDVEDYSFQPGDPAHGGIDYYGISGVCHQLSNRILFATAGAGGTPSTVNGAHGYGVSRFLYGTYGSDAAEWAARKARCLAPPTPRSGAPGTPVAMAMALPAAMTLEEDLAAMLRERLGPEVSRTKMAKIQQLHANLLRQKAQLDQALLSGAISPRRFADDVNHLVNGHLRQAVETLDPTEYERLFGIKPGETIGIVDPTVAELSNYKGRR